VGCHQKRQQVKNCAGCHGQTPPARLKETQCDQCHKIPLDQTPAPTGQNAEARVKELAKEFLAARKPVLDTYADEDIPEKVTIGWLSKEYQPAEFPHRKIVQTIAQGFKDRPLAHFFHADPGTLCQGCHHNSPPAKKPPQCLSCHGKPFSEAEPLRPGSTGAYHLQCMNCHHRMEVQKPGDTACVECHKKKEM
jgi:hypothetical protein